MLFFTYKSCSTCRKAKLWLEEYNYDFEEVAIRETPPSSEQLQQALQSGYSLRQLFNTSGKDYRELNIKNKLPAMMEADALNLLQSNGNLVKRPFVINQSLALCGFKEEVWSEKLLK